LNVARLEAEIVWCERVAGRIESGESLFPDGFVESWDAAPAQWSPDGDAK
jgi:hypothetical protein